MRRSLLAILVALSLCAASLQASQTRALDTLARLLNGAYTLILTQATMAPENTGQLRDVLHSYLWTNAMVVSLGASTTGDIKVATLPPKVAVTNAYVIITGQAGTVTTLTVACGRVAAGYIDYIVASDAKAAVNTVYGDASAERGTNLTGYDLPSYTATTDLFCHFISTGGNLNTVTASAGRVVLATELVP